MRVLPSVERLFFLIYFLHFFPSFFFPSATAQPSPPLSATLAFLHQSCYVSVCFAPFLHSFYFSEFEIKKSTEYRELSFVLAYDMLLLVVSFFYSQQLCVIGVCCLGYLVLKFCLGCIYKKNSEPARLVSSSFSSFFAWQEFI